MLRHCLFHQVEAGHNAAAQIMIVGGEGVDGYGGAAAHHHAGVFGEKAAAEDVEPAVGTVFAHAAVVVADAQGLRHGAEPFRLAAELFGHGLLLGFAAHCRADDAHMFAAMLLPAVGKRLEIPIGGFVCRRDAAVFHPCPFEFAIAGIEQQHFVLFAIGRGGILAVQRAQADFAAHYMMFRAFGIENTQRTTLIYTQGCALQQGLSVAQQANGLVLVAVVGVVAREEKGEAFAVELLESIRQLGQQAFGEAAYGDIGRTALHGFGIGHGFGLHKIDADADHNRSLAVAAHGFGEDAAELFAADHQIVRPFNLRGHAQIAQHAAASQRGGKREAAQLGRRAGKTPAGAEH